MIDAWQGECMTITKYGASLKPLNIIGRIVSHTWVKRCQLVSKMEKKTIVGNTLMSVIRVFTRGSQGGEEALKHVNFARNERGGSTGQIKAGNIRGSYQTGFAFA